MQMEEDIQKRNTDCVYFLASPLTCKKGLECEYRHNEIARLNPRDCWYWLAGDCYNPTCAFRHPPLEMHAEGPPELSSSSVPANKTNVPCYFFFNGFCNKGDRCFFMHGPEANSFTGKSGSTSSAIKENIPLDSKISGGNDTVSAPTEVNANPSETAAKAVKDLKLQPYEDFQFPAPEKTVMRSPSPQIAVSQSEEAVILNPSFLLKVNSFTESRSLAYTTQSPEEEMDDHVEPEERWESSPGFDVLVDDKSENLDYEDDQEYLLPLDMEQRDPNNCFLGYDFENLVEYDHAYHDAEDDYGSGKYDNTDFADNVHIFDDVGNDSGLSRNSVTDSLLSQKRKLVAMELSINDQRIVDLRDRLGKDRAIHGHTVIRSSRRHYSSHLLGHGQGRPGSNQRPHGKLVLEVKSTAIEPHRKNGSQLYGGNDHGWLRHSRSNRSRQRDKERRLARKQSLSSEVLRKPASKERKSSQASTQFTGPKTLAQIKEEKKKAEENGDYTGKTDNSSRMATADFESPKPLSEILKDKRRPSSA
ncbi:zinc finger CCCH domain-containing protein 34 [Ricinus communis]|uniref:Nucleic acid binding protein, putative n=1 Tax=Ricinus communis TaxID=3988 RepID=B9SEP4_RICCO|nr:zinc finger CCCH domain-containing protein 34 [Ricinus communis]EEF37903.1 nucleic acid binding protein, putative [Ricinus communis]|eukprot:XP_002524463.1 zinc finger CCCH domain-containing protein 34 [Ricinus communis]